MRGFALTLGFLALTTTALGQGSIGGYGQGGGMGGGGMDGGAFPNVIFQEPVGPGGTGGGRFSGGKRKSEQIQNDRGLFENAAWNTQTMIATPGVGCDWKFEGKAGEVLIAEAVSDVFDASIKVLDEKGKVLLENDDRYEGNQSPLIVYRFEKDQTIKVNVGSFKNASGGKFEFHSILYKSFTTKIGKTEVDIPGAEALYREGARTALFHFRAKKDETYYLSSYQTITKNSKSSGYVSRDTKLFGPSGVPKSDYELVDSGISSGKTFKALKDGDYFFEFSMSPSLLKAVTRLEPVKYETRPGLGKTTHTVAPRQQVIIKFPVSPESPIRTIVDAGPETANYLVGPTLPKDARNDDQSYYSEELFGILPTFCWFALDGKPSNALRVFFAKGDATLVLTNHSDKPEVFTITNDEPLENFKEGAETQDTLSIGHSRLYKYESLQNEMMRLRCEGTSFRLRVDIFNYRGQIVNSFVDGINNKPGDDLYFPKADKFLFRVTCVGNGGSGKYTLRRDPIGAEALSIGEKKQISLDGKNFGIYEVNLEAGKRYSLTSLLADGYASFMTMAEDGTALQPSSHQYDNIRTDILKVEKSGKYRIWVRGGGNANVTFKIAPYKPPTIDD